MFRILIVDDEPLALQHLDYLLRAIPNSEVVAQTTDGSSVLHLIKEHQPNLIFLDINIGIDNGIDLAEQIKLLYPEIHIVFVTAHSEHAVKAFELDADDYLLKPVTRTRLIKTFSKLKSNSQINMQQDNFNLPKNYVNEPYLHIFSFRQGKVLNQQNQFIKFRTKKVEELLFFLWQESDAPPSRERILEELWPELDEEKASTLFHSTLYQLRKTLTEYQFKNPVKLQNKIYQLTINMKSDVEQWDKIITQPIENTSVEEALKLYTGDYLELNQYPWAIPKRNLYQEKWNQYIIRCLNNTNLSPRILNLLITQFKEEQLFNQEGILALLNYFGRTKQMLQLTQIYEQAKKAWNQELGLDLPHSIMSTYSDWIKTN